MKVILLSDVKKVGKKNQVLEVADGYARNYLIKNKLAVEATKKSMEVLDQQKLEDKLHEEELKKEAQEVAKKLESIMLTFQVKCGQGGRVFGSVSTKQIADELAKRHGIKIDKRKFLDANVVDNLGVTKLKIELFKDVIGEVSVRLLEQKQAVARQKGVESMVRELPHETDVEKAVLGELMTFPEAIREATDQGLTPHDFFYQNHGQIFEAMVELNDAGQQCDITTVLSKLQNKGLAASVGGVDYLGELLQYSMARTSVKTHIRILVDKAQIRRLNEASRKIEEQTANPDADLDTVLIDSEKLIMDVIRSRNTSDFKRGSDVVEEVNEQIVMRSQVKTSMTGMKTGYVDLDRLTGGLQKGDLIILAARPSVGKTAFALNLCTQVAARNQPEGKNGETKGHGVVALFELEMPAEQLMMRMLSAESRVQNTALRSGKLNGADEWQRLSDGVNRLKQLPIFIDDSSTIKANEIFAKCHKLEAEENGIDLIVIDYLQLISGRGRASDNRQVEVSEISRSLKQLAREMNCPVIALSQLSRSIEQREDKTPMLSDLRESGSIEQDADIVMFLDRDDYYGKKKDAAKEEGEVPEEVRDNDFAIVNVIVAKHRNGKLDTIKLGMSKSISRFDNFESREA